MPISTPATGRTGFRHLSRSLVSRSLVSRSLGALVGNRARRIALCAVCLVVTMGNTRSTGPGGTSVDVALLLAVDVSNSVNWFEYELQKYGIAKAIRDPEVVKTINAGRNRRIVVSIVQWSGAMSHRIAVPWTLLFDQASAEKLSKIIRFMPREFDGDSTNISGVIAFGTDFLADIPYLATRKVIDISGDGRENVSDTPEAMRDRAVAAGITINGLAIENEEKDLRFHYRDRIIGGPGAFVLPVKRYEDFAAAMKKKLIREIDPNRVSWAR